MNRKLRNQELARLTETEFKKADKSPIVVVLDNVRSLNNIGSVFRTADAFLIKKIYLCGITAIPPHRDITKTALGSTESVEWEYCSSTIELIERLQREGSEVWAVEQTENSIGLDAFVPKGNMNIALVFGHEVKGVSQDVIDLCNGSIEIPQYGTKHSLNISVSVGVVLWDVFMKTKKALL